MAVAMVIWPRLAKFARDYPEVVLDITTEGDSRPDLVAGRFDAGVHLGEFIQRDMVAVKITRQQRAAIVVAPAYFDSQAQDAAGPHGPQLHQPPFGRHRISVPVGVREARQAGHRLGIGARHLH